MQDTSLNLIAIAIFLMTMTTLLGPMFNLSPLVPAIATITVFGIAAVDIFGWKGRGATILLDSLAGTSSAHRDRILRHEAGHFLVAHLLEINITGYSLSAWEAFQKGQPGQGGVALVEPKLTVSLLPGIIEKYCTIWMAGIAAETLVYGSAEGGTEDRQQLRFALTQIGKKQSESIQQERWAINRAKTLIHEHWEAYEALIVAMQQRATVEECCRIIEQNC